MLVNSGLWQYMCLFFFFCSISFKLLKIKNDKDKSRKPVYEVHIKMDSHSQSEANFSEIVLNMKKILIVMAA